MTFTEASSDIPRRVVVVDDDAGDRNLVLRAARGLGVDVVPAETAEEALDLLDVSQSPTQVLVLLDLNLLTHDGSEVLRALDAQGRVGRLAVVVFTNSRRPEDVDECYALGAKSFVRKPSSFGELKQTLAELTHYWFETVELPAAI